MVGLLLLFRCQLLSRLCHRAEATGGILLLRTTQQIAGFAQTICGAAGIGGAGTLGGCAFHIFVRLVQAVECLLCTLLTAVGRLLRGLPGIRCTLRGTGLSGLTSLSTTLTRRTLTRRTLSGSRRTLLTLLAPALLTLLALLSLLSLLSLGLLALLTLLRLLGKLLLHLLLKLRRFALQHFLLPFLFGRLRSAIALLLSETFLALSQFIEFLQRLVDFLRFLFGRRGRARLRVILILLGIEFQIEKAGQIARRTAATPAASTAAGTKRNLNLPESSLRAQQELQSLLLVRNRVLPLLLLQLLLRRRHRFGGGDHILLEVADGLHFVG